MDYGRRDRASESEWLERHAESVHRIETPGFAPWRFVSSARALRRVALECDGDIVLTLYGGSLAATAYLSRVRPYAVYIVGSDILLATLPQRIVARIALTASAAVLANGKHLARRVRELAPKANVAPLYLGIDLMEYSASPGDDHHPSFVCTRGFLDVYDNATIVRAFALLGEVAPDITITFLSSGPLLEETERLADALIPPSWRDRIVFLGGASHEELKRVVKSASFYLSASLSDGTSSSLLEAMASGLVPIVSDIPANREWIVSEANGLLFSPGNHRELAGQIRRAIKYEPWMAKARTANRRLVEERADADVNTIRLLEILNQCLL
jgi:L-malate glycosyltransferase